jgi:hypothetical protein
VIRTTRATCLATYRIQNASYIRTSNSLTPTRCALSNMSYNPSSNILVNVPHTRTNVPRVPWRDPVPFTPACSSTLAYPLHLSRFFFFLAVIGSHPSSSCLQHAKHRRRGSSPTAFPSFLLLPGPSPFHLLRGRFSSFCVGLSEISLSRLALPDRSSQANPALLGFSSSGSVR